MAGVYNFYSRKIAYETAHEIWISNVMGTYAMGVYNVPL